MNVPRASISRVSRESDGIVTLDFRYLGDSFPGQLWTRCKARKSSTCVVTGQGIEPGDVVYRPVSNARNRMYRIAAKAIDQIGGRACAMKTAARPCPSCPWRIDQSASDIPNFDLSLAEALAPTSPDARGMGPDFGASMFACHQSKIGGEIPCAGWLAKVGHRHPGVRMAVMSGRISADALAPGPGWPELHNSYPEVLDKLRATLSSED